MIVVALDPGAQVGMARRNGSKIDFCKTFDWHKRREQLEAAIVACFVPGAIAFIEEPGQGHWCPPGVSRSHYDASVGGCKVRAEELARSCKRAGYDVRMKRPIRGQTTRRITPVRFGLEFPELVGKRKSHHAMDACLMAAHWGRLAEYEQRIAEAERKAKA
jgi:hypothetical protein